MKKLYYGGTILTMNQKSMEAEILVTDHDKIVYVGPNLQHYHVICEEKINLKGKCLMPAFLDAHSHFLSVAGSFLQISLKDVTTWEEIENRVRNYLQENQPKQNIWVQGVGYDQTLLPGGQHPHRQFLDALCPNHPLILQHISGHMGVLNSKALDILQITDMQVEETTTIDPESGLLQEAAFVECLKKIPPPDISALLAACEKAQQIYASYGITTVQEGMMVKEMIPIYQALLGSEILKLDVIAYADRKDANLIYDTLGHKEIAHFKLGGYKIFLDGSPQGGTAWMREPYLGTTNCGEGTMSDEEVLEAVEFATHNRCQIIAHCNGDRACGQFLSTLEKVEKQNKELLQMRPVLIHAQFIGKDQLPIAKKVGAVLSFFVSHVLHWGDIHIEKFGLQRASGISPGRSAFDYHIPVTFHTDAPVIFPDLLEAVDCAVNRKTKKGIALGLEEAISVQEALEGITIQCAYQYFEEKEKGSLEPGKKADLVILDKNPLKTDQQKLHHIRVLETIKDGKSIYCRA